MTASAPSAGAFRRARRIASIQVSEILRIGATARSRRREGRPVIVLGAGEPDFDTPDNVKEAAVRAIRAGQTKYTTLDGTVELKAAIAMKFKRENGLDYAADEITAGAGAKQVMHNAFLATLNPGDEVILAAPYWTSYAMTGWRLGYAGGPKALIAAMAIVQSQSTTNPCSISQAAAIEALTGPQDLLPERRMVFQRRRDMLVDKLNGIDGVTCRRPEGAFYTFASCAGLMGRRTPNGALIDSDSAFCDYLLEAYDLAVVPGSCFGLSPHFRISYAASDADLNEACERLALACKALE